MANGVLRVFGLKIVTRYLGQWQRLSLTTDSAWERRMYPIGWRIAGLNEPDVQSELDRFIRTSR